MELTSQEPRAGFPLTFEITAKGLPKKSWVKISQIGLLGAVCARKLCFQFLFHPFSQDYLD